MGRCLYTKDGFRGRHAVERAIIRTSIEYEVGRHGASSVEANRGSALGSLAYVLRRNQSRSLRTGGSHPDTTTDLMEIPGVCDVTNM